MKKILLLLVLFVGVQETFSQNTIFIGNKSYPCTGAYVLELESFSTDKSKIEINFIKDGERGIIAFTINNYMMPYSRVKNKLVLYLDDNQVITCIDRGKYDIVDDYATTLYYLTKEEVNKLKKSNISTIRYTFGDNYDISLNRTVSNLDIQGLYGVIKRIDFPSELKDFYK